MFAKDSWAKHNLGTHKSIWCGTALECHPLATDRPSTQQKRPLLRLQSQKCASLAAIAKYIRIELVLQIFKAGRFFQRCTVLLFKETINYYVSLSSKTCQRHFETRAANIWTPDSGVSARAAIVSKNSLRYQK